MKASSPFRHFRFTSFLSLPFMLSLALLSPAQAQSQSPAIPSGNDTQPDLTDPTNLRPLNQNDSILSRQGGERLMAEAMAAVNAQNYSLATKKLQESRQVFNQLSNFYQQLFTTFSGIDNRVAESQRAKAVEAGDMRDQATYQLALVHRAQSQHELAVPLLIQVVRSQNPTRELGRKAYQQLFEVGFVDTAFPGNTPSSQPTSSAPAPASSAPRQ